MFNSSCSSSYIETTYSQDMRIEEELKALREEEQIANAEKQQRREEYFNEVFMKKAHTVFDLKGLYFLYFNHIKIKFYFQPSKFTKYVRKDLKFYCKMVYQTKYEWWYIKRDSFPVNCKSIIYSGLSKTIVEDTELFDVINDIYKCLLIWTQSEEEFRLDKRQRLLRGELDELVDLDSDDCDLILTKQEKKRLNAKRRAILKRMIPPKRYPTRNADID
ncbi:uncharacterized protein LOC126884932 [Diabrotica virgifera virgifera]|uniref:Uncharacterized protein n=2 Tax=Diabrotica virgifera virgifera TaxID=50390 RepID=A0ABM5KAM7_DIAVI|nr:uncharacterized protein LOC126884932 [Diabrotica virgifera virgifera]XP_050507243.1 uncharacterized protein LOC126884932 [Diabrotica virgifera virgifera]